MTIIPGRRDVLDRGQELDRPELRQLRLGGAVAGNFNKYVGVEGEVTGSLGISQTLTGFAIDIKTPHMLNYTGNVVVSIPAGKSSCRTSRAASAD